ncbi:MAG: hypothetical protein ABJP70_10685 [Erythrobacter sp.]
MRIGFGIVLLAATLAACTPAKEQAMEECQKQKGALPASVDGDQFCNCLTSKIPEDASVSDAKEILTQQTQSCISEQLQGLLQAPPAPAAPAPAE